MKSVDRRTWLKRGLAALAAAGLGVTARLSGYPPAPGMVALDAASATLFARLAETICAAPGLPPPDVPAVVARVDAFVAALPAATRDLIGWLCLGFEQGTLAGGHLSRFSALDPRARRAWLRRWERSPSATVRSGFAALKTLVYAAYWDEPGNAAVIGYDGPVVPPGFRIDGHGRYDALLAPPGAHPEQA